MRKVVVNSTPLLVLGNIGRLDILQKLYGTVFIPAAVYKEVSEKNDRASKALSEASEWIIVKHIDDSQQNRKGISLQVQRRRKRLHRSRVFAGKKSGLGEAISVLCRQKEGVHDTVRSRSTQL